MQRDSEQRVAAFKAGIGGGATKLGQGGGGKSNCKSAVRQLTLVENLEGDVDGLVDCEPIGRVELLVQQQHGPPLLLILCGDEEEAECDHADD